MHFDNFGSGCCLDRGGGRVERWVGQGCISSSFFTPSTVSKKHRGALPTFDRLPSTTEIPRMQHKRCLLLGELPFDAS